MVETILAKDWSRTALGPIDSWPQSLRTTVSLCLASNFPISIAWGPRRVQIYNDGYWPICGAKHPHSMGQDFKECWLSAWPAVGEAFEHAQLGQTSFLENQRMFLDRNGYLEETFFTFSFSPIRDESGEVCGLFHPVTETTSRMLSERRIRALRDLATRAARAKTVGEACQLTWEVLAGFNLDLPFGLIYLFESDDEYGRLAASFGFASDTAASPKIVALRGGADPDHEWPVQDALRAGGMIEVENLDERFGALPCGPYPESPKQAIVVPISRIGFAQYAGVLIAGVSSRLPLDESYRSFYDLLAGHIATALASARSYEEQRRKAEALAELDRAKTAFFSNVSHEFRTPLTLMLAPLEDLLARGDAGSPSAREELSRIHRNALRLLKLVNTLLDFSRIEAGRIQAVYEPVDLSHLTADLASAFRSAIERAGVELVVDCLPLPEPVYVDREMWEKIVLNLVSNAFKFTFEGRIAVRLRTVGSLVELAVEDTGTGIGPSELPRIFERFHRIQGAKTRTHEGTGIGLALVQELARLHGGSISVSSEYGRGSVFTVQIPRGPDHLPPDRIHGARRLASTATGSHLFVEEASRWIPNAPASYPAEAAPGEVSGSMSRGRVLLADDNADMRDYLRRVLAERFEVHAVADGVEALEFARREPVDLVLTDVMMPRMDGFELLRELRGNVRTSAIPVILLSARAGEKSRVEGLEAGADDYLVKPFTVRELLARIDGQIHMARVRKEAAALQESDLRFRTIADYAPVMMWTCDPDRRCDYFNKGWLDYTGRTLAETIAEGWAASLHPDDRERCAAEVDAAFAGSGRFEMEFRARRHNGEYRWVSGAGAPRFLADGSLLGHVFSCVDIDDRKRATEAAQEAQERLQLALDAANEGLWDWNFATGEGYFGPRYLSILGYTPGEIQPSYDLWLKLVHPDDLAAVVEERNQQIRRLDGAFTTEYRLRRKDGGYIWVESSGKVITRTPDGNPARIVGTIADITGRRTLEDQYYQSQKLESIGRLAGGVAHDFNNLLTVINGYTAMIMDDLAADDPSQESLAEIRTAGERAAGLTQQLLAFSSKQILQPVVLNLNHVVADIAKMLQRLIGEDIHLAVRLAEDLGNVTADPGQLHQIVMNLAVNSRDAMHGGGTLTIETANIYLDENYVREHPRLHIGEHVMLAVTDTGAGMTPDVQERIFEPFFTTKPKGHGTGLGLATVYGIVTQSGGWIWVYSELGKGTTFKIYLPRTAEPPAQERVVVRGNLRGTEAILVVEDQDDVRRLAIRSLEKYGYTVFNAGDAEQAIAFCERHKGPLDLVLTDIVMPGLNGRELAQLLSVARPDLRFLFMSGYTENAIAHNGVLDGSLKYLQKPFTPDALAESVREILGSSQTRSTILLVDEDPSARTELRRHLAGNGYAVLEAGNGRQAAAIIWQSSRIDLVILDMAMEGTEGLEALAVLREGHPEVKIIAMSRASGEDDGQIAGALKSAWTLQKPVSPEALLEGVHAVLRD
jgi:PAS domain S-box-containing protein